MHSTNVGSAPPCKDRARCTSPTCGNTLQRLYPFTWSGRVKQSDVLTDIG